MRKKYLVTTVAMLAAVSVLAACGNKNENNDNTTPTPTVTVAPTTAPTEAPSSDERGDGPSTPAPTETPVAEVDHAQMMNNMYQAVQEAFGATYTPSMQGDEFFMNDTLKLESSWYDIAITDRNAMGVLPDTFILIHPTEGNLENVQKALEAYKSTLAENAWYPTTTTRAKGAISGTLGEYVYFVVLTGNVDDMAYTDENAIIEACKESSKRAVDVMAAVVSGELVVEPWTETEKVANAVRKAYQTSYYPNVQMQDDPTYMTDLLKLDASWYTEALVEIPMISANADTFILIKATEGNVENVQNALNAYKTYLVEESFQYPMNELRVKSAVVGNVGEYVFFSILGGALDNPADYGIAEDDSAAMLEYYTTKNSDAEWAIRNYLNIWE